MRLSIALIVLLPVLPVAPSFSEDTKAPTSHDFRLSVKLRDVAAGPATEAEMIGYQGRILQMIDGRSELILIDPIARRIEVLNLDRKCIARISFDRLDAEVAAYKSRLQTTVDKLAVSTHRADKLNAAKTGDLLTPKGKLIYDKALHTLRRVGETTEAEARGVPDRDADRLALIRASLTSLIKLDTYRSPEKVPPFVQLQAIDALITEHRLRPTEMSFLYRLNGPPIRFLWTYKLTPGLAATDLELLTKLQEFRRNAALIDFDAYDRPPRPPRASAPAGG